MTGDLTVVRLMISKVRGMDDLDPEKERWERELMRLQGFLHLDVHGLTDEEAEMMEPEDDDVADVGKGYGLPTVDAFHYQQTKILS
jgi:hypothetical protein